MIIKCQCGRKFDLDVSRGVASIPKHKCQVKRIKIQKELILLDDCVLYRGEVYESAGAKHMARPYVKVQGCVGPPPIIHEVYKKPNNL